MVDIAAMELCLRAPQLSALGFRHGFSLRSGGASVPPYESLNLGRVQGDDPTAVEENHRRFAAAVGYGAERFFEVSQVHSCTVRAVTRTAQPQRFRAQEADALVANTVGDAVGVRTADCVPLLVADPSSGAVAAVHAGWRGVVAGVVPEALSALLSMPKADVGRVRAAIFPHIRPCCFEVGEEVATALREIDQVAARPAQASGKPHGDLALAVRRQLLSLGLKADQVEDVPGCTMCEASRFFSYRRDGQRSGRHLAAIVASAPRT